MGGGVAIDSDTRPSTRSPPSHYRPQLDGLRAVAVYLVVAYHAGIHNFSGGFIGVDVFFVLSGFLVTQLLLRDLSGRGRIDLRRFYSRRFRRLLPAAFVTLVVTAAVYTAVAAPAQVAGARGGFRAAFLYVANWHFISQSNDYFAANVNTNPVVHFWSLAVEEQFYICWPLLLAGAYALAGRAGDARWKVVRLIMAAGCAASLLWALHLSTVNLNRAYYGTDTRAYELLAGALVAITPRVLDAARDRRRLVQALTPVILAVLLVLATPVIHLGQIQRGVAATVASAAFIVALVTSTGWVTRALSTTSARYLGRVSYGTYLWHWPVIVIATTRFHPSPVALFALTVLIATGLASLSFDLLEQRVRLSSMLDRHRSAVIGVGLAASLIGGLVLVPAIMSDDRGAASVSAPAGGGGTNATSLRVPPGLDLEAISSAGFGRPDCYHRAVATCTIVHGKGPSVLVIGDSHATSLTPAFIAVARKYSLTLAIASAPNCPWERGVVEVPVASSPALPKTCRSHQRDWYRRIVPKIDPDVIVLVHRPFDDPTTPSEVRLPNDAVVLAPDQQSERALESVTRSTLDQLRQPGRKVVLLEPLPVAPGTFDPFTCLSEAKYLDACRYVATARPTTLERFYRSIANGTDVYALDLDRLVCPYLPICDPIVGGVVVKRDPQHITVAFSRQMGASIGPLLVADGVIPGPQ